ncbi:hypothetical protein [Maricaulis sp. MIT060901]|uniref:hypothetical protein n=1 Tax=Maricaulis sp. MIT060901 TaxID=3096993 RepID=UPI00399A8FA6
MAIQLPSGGLEGVGEFLIDHSNKIGSATGVGPETEIERAGSKWGFNVAVSAKTADEALAWKKLHRRGEPFLLDIIQPGLDVGNPGTPLVSIGGQVGSQLPIKGLTPGYTLVDGQFLSVIVAGQRYAYMVTADTVADGTGNATVPITPLLRAAPQLNDVVEIAAPKAEGWVTVPASGFNLDVVAVMRGLKFVLREVA